jgi:hypothetical protein
MSVCGTNKGALRNFVSFHFRAEFESALPTNITAATVCNELPRAKVIYETRMDCIGYTGAPFHVQALPRRRQTMLFTATVTAAVQELQDHILKSPCVFRQYTGLQTTSNLREQHIRMQAHVKELYLVYVLQRLQQYNVRSGVLFCGTKDTCEFIGGLLYQLKQSAVTLHSGKKQKARLGALNKVCKSNSGAP